MKHAKDIAEQATEIAVAVVAFSTGAASGIGQFAVAGAVLGAIGASIWSSCADRACKHAVEAILIDMRDRPGITDATHERASAILADRRDSLTLDPTSLARLARQGSFPETVTAHLLVGLGLGPEHAPFPPLDYDARSLLELALQRAISI